VNETLVVGVKYLEEEELQPVKVELRFNEGKASLMITRAIRYAGPWTFEEASAVMFFSKEKDEVSARAWANEVMKQELSQ
jgi:hypothetical protein